MFSLQSPFLFEPSLLRLTFQPTLILVYAPATGCVGQRRAASAAIAFCNTAAAAAAAAAAADAAAAAAVTGLSVRSNAVLSCLRGGRLT